MVKLDKILELINIIAPFNIAEEWDNCGLQAGSFDWEVKKVIIGLDVSSNLMSVAKENSCDLVLAHHPLILQPEKIIDFGTMPGKVIEIAAQHKINIVCAHTNLDKAHNGLNDYFAAQIGILNTKILCRENSSLTADGGASGIGRTGFLEKTVSLEQLAQTIKNKLSLSHLRVTGDMNLPVKTVAVCTGSGGSLIDLFLKSDADVYITGDIKYHEARVVEQNSKAIIDVGHFGSEHMAVDVLFEKLTQEAAIAKIDIEIIKYKDEKDPFNIV